MAGVYVNPVVRRRRLAEQYKAIEGETIPSLLGDANDVHTWSKIDVLRGVMHEHEHLDDEFRNAAAEKITQAIALRKEAMPLWPAGTEAEERHWDWIDILERMTAVLKTSRGDGEVAARNAIVDDTPAAVANDEKPWTNVDLDIYLKQMGHWRQTLADICQMAMDDPKQMSVADISIGCAIRYFKTEMAAMELSYEDWYDEFGSYKDTTLQYMERREPDGLGGELSKICESLKGKKVREIEDELKKADFHGFPPENDRWLFADRARHINPLIHWARDIIRRTQKHNNTTSHAEFLLFWLFISDSVKHAQERKQQLKAAAVRRLNEVLKTSMLFDDIFGPGQAAKIIYNEMVQRVQAMTKYVMQQDSVPSIAVAHTWADYSNVMLNVLLFQQTPVRTAVYLFEANVLLNRWQKLPAATQIEQFCNRFGDYVYPDGRPTTEAEWKSHASEWKDEEDRLSTMDFNSLITTIIGRMTDYTRVDKCGKSWARIAIIEDHLTVKREDFEETQGTTKWWEAIKKRAEEELRVPSIGPLHVKIRKDFNTGHQLAALQVLTDYKWRSQRKRIETILETFPISPDWFDGILD
ncbi:hypothetical protein GGR58DRAFT_508757 [Xylaria digitata]|nr:hypothetical protein GGR58DRAFT_508757 [Xylaria digitata]